MGRRLLTLLFCHETSAARMTDWDDYELIDFGANPRGEGRRLERFGSVVVDRPCPAASGTKKAAPDAWGDAVARYDGARAADGKWTPKGAAWAEGQACRVPVGGGFALGVTPTPAGQVGMFPEQFENWRWIANRVARAGKPLRVLNLFAYTGGSTLAAASAAAAEAKHPVEVTHVDASKPSVAIARRNAELNGLADAPIRWIVEDALKYARREARRGNGYDAVILDPPSYGHGPKGEEWRVERDLPELLGLCGELCGRAPAFLLATCHSPGVGPAELSAYLADGVFGSCSQPAASGALWLKSRDGRKLESGVVARWPG
ncbi:Ribosomal RNA large subunit methyltransferase I [Pseudobythopirellula maris]|uniref:Ribosomal RNA large subunit methyltransferase I n=1 Tax=Pseudobythopirellula maris TaxID=2527991 RepID=A0A5C5ZNW0_9BACT|nr:class I SAM-dependent methyltransferase [Pseudobythopirellula maris]TWT88826.1 Ribosomal RNA large subunit methyltransferase I [Pseudobythopirellula maris]